MTKYCFYKKGDWEKEISDEEIYDYVKKKLLEFMEEKNVFECYIDMVIDIIIEIGYRAILDTNLYSITIESVEKQFSTFFKDKENLKELARKLLYKEFDYSSFRGDEDMI